MGTGLVYVNYGREEDFEKLAELGVSVKDAILIARYGKIFRGNKVRCPQLTVTPRGRTEGVSLTELT
ncbi:N-acetylated-alpha-linked acidic dipeptidase 2 [Portunus trituberculatus]|uniref:N-acetylated-alpha-linked acidic dipeptidase 2 n=1 Tax=Portunus trituberculatus TaxID=210409 RepID=A0A5B7J066_PORTR|nr:N-acetylated-alpha-linked acidic dipeptidase 2 [Portunus trituberculatus]